MSVNDATRWVLMGYGPLGRRVLEASLEGAWPPAGVMTHSEPSDLEDPSVESVARKAGLLVSTANPNEEGLQWLADLRPDTIFTINYRLILSPEVLAVPAIGGFNIHGSLLPRLRGRAPLTWAIIQGHRETGVTVHKLEPEVDTGEIVVQERIPIDVKDTSASIQTRMAELYPSMVRDTLEAVGTGRLTTRPQVGGPSYGAARRPDDGEIDWSWGAKRIYDWVRALSKPYPGAFTHLESEKVMIWKASDRKSVV